MFKSWLAEINSDFTLHSENNFSFGKKLERFRFMEFNDSIKVIFDYDRPGYKLNN